MSISATVLTNVRFSGDYNFNVDFPTTPNAASPGSIQTINLVTGDNTILIPQPTGAIAKGVIIVPPSGNTIVLGIRGTADTGVGILISKTNPTNIAFDTLPPTSFIVKCTAAGIDNCKFIWY